VLQPGVNKGQTHGLPLNPSKDEADCGSAYTPRAGGVAAAKPAVVFLEADDAGARAEALSASGGRDGAAGNVYREHGSRQMGKDGWLTLELAEGVRRPRARPAHLTD